MAVGSIVAGVLVIIAVGYLPRLLRPASQVAAERAARQAELARRQIHRYDPALEVLAARSDLETLKGSPQAREAGRSVQEFAKLLEFNRRLLREAKKNAQQAARQARDAVGVAAQVGLAHYVEAQARLAEARRVRNRFQNALAEARLILVRLAELEAQAEHYAAIDTTAALEQLRGDLAEIEGLLEKAEREASELAAQVQEREALLADLGEQLDKGRAELLTLEEIGFTPGDDTSFEAYRQRYGELAAHLAELQVEEQLLRDGGLRGASFADEQFVEGEMSGGEPVVGLDELRQRLAIVNDKVQRYTVGRQAIQDRIETLEASGQAAAEMSKRAAARLAAIEKERDNAAQRVQTLLDQLMKVEQAALDAAQQSVRAFKQARQAAQTWKRKAREVQSSRDPQRSNERLKRIVQDRMVETDADTAGAQADTLLGRIHLERTRLLGEALPTLERLGVQADLERLRKTLGESQQAAVKALSEARDVYAKVAQAGGNTAWIHQAALATVEHLLAQAEPERAEEHRAAAMEALRQVTERAGKTPYAHAYVRMYEYLQQRSP